MICASGFVETKPPSILILKGGGETEEEKENPSKREMSPSD